MSALTICYVASEIAPFMKTGGLGDVLGALPKAVAQQGHNVKVFVPYYRHITLTPNRLRSVEINHAVNIQGKQYPIMLYIYRNTKTKVEMYFIGNDEMFSRAGVYVDPETNQDYEDNDERFIFFNKAVFAVMAKQRIRPDIVHVHDWQTAIFPVYGKTTYASEPELSNTKYVLTIHNLAYQGVFPPETFDKLDLDKSLLQPMTGPFEFYGKVNFLKAGILFADKITTVSKQYASEIQTSEFGCGLEGVLKKRSEDIHGILNGVDYTVWSPSRDRKLFHTYHIANLSGKRMNKVELLNEAHLPIRDTAPLIGMITRLVDQKGLDLVVAAAKRLFAMNVQMVILGTGDQKYHDAFKKLQEQYPDKFRAFLKFDDTLAHRIEAASDIYLMPSRFEPCGLNQLYSLKYGTVPVVRKVGGLADTVVDYNPATKEGTGFVFEEYTPEAMLGAIERAVELFQKKRAWTKVMKAGMREDFSWNKSATKYIDLYQQVHELSSVS